MTYLILGASAAGINAAKTLRKLDRFAEITMVSEDRFIYSRSMLQYYVTGKRDLDRMNFVEYDFIERYNIRWVNGVTATDVDTYNKRVYLSNSSYEPYDKLLIATGSSPIIPDIQNIERSNNIFCLHSMEDALAIENRLKTAKSVIILGGGLIGVDIAAELLNRNIKVTIVEYGNNLLALQLDEKAAKPYEKIITEAGVKIFPARVGKEVLLDRNNNFRGLVLTDNTEILADMIIISAGVSPNLDFIQGSEILMNRGVVAVNGELLREGILVNKKSETNVKDIYAAGDVCAEKLSIWPLAVKQGIVAAYNMAGMDKEIDSFFGQRNAMNFFGIDTISIGDPNLQMEGMTVEYYEDGNNYKRISHKDGYIYNVILQGDIRQAGVYEMLIKFRINIGKLEKNVFDIGFGDFFSINQKTGNLYYDLEKYADLEDQENPMEKRDRILGLA